MSLCLLPRKAYLGITWDNKEKCCGKKGQIDPMHVVNPFSFTFGPIHYYDRQTRINIVHTHTFACHSLYITWGIRKHTYVVQGLLKVHKSLRVQNLSHVSKLRKNYVNFSFVVSFVPLAISGEEST